MKIKEDRASSIASRLNPSNTGLLQNNDFLNLIFNFINAPNV